MTKLFLIFAAIIAGTMGGFCLSKVVGRKEKYFAAILNMTDKLICEMKFRQSSLVTLLTEFKSASDCPLNLHIDEFINYINTGGELKLSKSCLNKEELSVVEDFFKSLGKTDSATQIFTLQGFKERFAAIYKKAAEKNKKYGSLYVKLGFLFGLGVGIILL